ncbi:hypothetical protein N7520_003647 [Penicillium odoratum]|uniref:uncharacterized protein n=1 Tax=Penicillium odoratum TaxID=1167516 RepID=UPI0025485DA3|nr:uncharacterized protein N7520_003647 [Penicillium odoratum]KAJ5769088.1 hypothetical protein N7520_003647 [Penicillium odoratum]
MIKGVNEHDGVTAFFGGITKVGAPPNDLSTEIYEMVDWMSKVELYENLGRTKKESRVGYYWEQASPSHYRHVTSPPSQEVYEPKIMEALNQAHALGICENRLLNIISASERADFDLPALVTDITITRQPRNFTHRESADRLNDAAKTMHIPRTQNIGHTECTSTICHFATIDSTRVSILHKCASRGCRTWSPSEEDFNRPGPYTWCISNDVPRPGQGNYAAISHVWSDGTGSANDSVNRCLFDYFCSIAKAEKCNAIWWDAISIPRETKARALSIRRMHRNFSDAKITIVHDLYTATYPWANDGSPCIALALSPWFTRGWTALELLVSKNVKVIFQHPNDPKRYVIKDLETEVLASHPAYCSRGHWIASTAIRRLRQMKIQSVTDLLHLLATRSTTWESDRLVIAALVRGLDTNVQGPDIKAALTREIITSFPKIDPSFLHHGYSLPRKQGIFSWCPSTLLHGGKPFVSPGYNSTEWLNVSKDGTLIGSFTMKILEENDKDSLSAFAQEPAARSRINMALRKWRHCMLIWPRLSNGMLRDPAILVTVIEIGVIPPSPTNLLDCRMEGTVYGGLPSSGYHVSVRLGKTSDSPSKSARELYDLWIKEYLNVCTSMLN